jgi:pimeloyl-ACP methyl ester carboxylesterase
VALTRRIIEVQGLDIEIHEGGGGDALLFLHDHDGVDPAHPIFDILTANFRVIAPSHPGFGASSLPEWMDRIEDFAFAYLDVLDQLGLDSITLVGASIGAWIAAELAIMASDRLAQIVLIAPLGVKVGGRDKLDMPDLFAVTPDDVRCLTYANSERAQLDMSKLSDAELTTIAHNRETLALTAWSPYMHNPKLKHRLHRLRAPTLLIRGKSDKITSSEYADSFASLIPGARVATIPGGGHFVHHDQPEAVGLAIRRFTAPSASAAAVSGER